jgi:hypothetical protein
LIHRFNLVFESTRGAGRAELAGGVDHDWYGVGVCRCNVTNAADKAAVAHVCTSGADSNNVIGGGNAAAGFKPQGRVVVAGGVGNERTKTDGRVGAPGGVALERLRTVGRVEGAGGVVKERKSAVSRVLAAGSVLIKRLITVGRVKAAGGVDKERSKPMAVLPSPWL